MPGALAHCLQNPSTASMRNVDNREKGGKLFGRTVLPNITLFGGTVLRNNTLFGRTDPTNSMLFDRTPDSENPCLICLEMLELCDLEHF